MGTRTRRARAVGAVERACSEAAHDARISERKWWRQEIAKLFPDESGMVSISDILYISEKRKGE